MSSGVFHWDSEKQAIVDGPASSGPRDVQRISKRGDDGGGVSFQYPPGWTDGSGKVRHVPSGPLKGRVMFESRREAKDLAKRLEDRQNQKVHYDPE